MLSMCCSKWAFQLGWSDSFYIRRQA